MAKFEILRIYGESLKTSKFSWKNREDNGNNHLEKKDNNHDKIERTFCN